jgi:tetratricopeptide (TPR) repeat protein
MRQVRTGCIWWLLAGLVIWSPGCARTPDTQLVQQFQAAQEAFDAAQTPEEFLRAAGLYQAILDRGCRSGAVLYNQGNAFMRAGQTGRAIACYRQAQRYRPRDPFLDHNLRYALGAKASSKPSSLLDYFFFWQRWISYAAKFRLLAAMALVTFALGLAALLAADRKTLAYAAWVALAASCLMAASATYDWYRFDAVQHGVVTAEQTVARKGNGQSYAPAFTQPLAEGTEFRVVERRHSWLLIRLPADQEGWVRGDDVVVY